MNNRIKAHPREQSIKELFIRHCWSYLNDNFHKFTPTNQIKVALELCKKDVPQEILGMNQQIIVSAVIQKVLPSGEPNQEPVNRLAEFLIGSPPSPENTGCPAEVSTAS